jgi:hypothetical protein
VETDHVLELQAVDETIPFDMQTSLASQKAGPFYRETGERLSRGAGRARGPITGDQ